MPLVTHPETCFLKSLPDPSSQGHLPYWIGVLPLNKVTFWDSRAEAPPSILRGDTVGSVTLLALCAHHPMRVVVFIKKCASLTVLDGSDAAGHPVLSGLRTLNIKISGFNTGGLYLMTSSSSHCAGSLPL